MKKLKCLTVIMAAMLLVWGVPAGEFSAFIEDGELSVWAAETVTYGALTYEKYSTYMSIIGVDTEATEIEIPYEIEGLPVKNILASADFEDCPNLETVTIDMEEIPFGSFENCTALTSVTIGENVRTIGWGAFSGCASLTSVTIPDSIVSIGTSSFKNCVALTSVVIGENVETIEWDTFSGCTSLTSVIIPDSVTFIDWCAFANCSALTSVKIGENMKIIGLQAFSGCTSLTSVSIPDSVTSIEDGAFENCTALASVTIGESVETIGLIAFENCTSLMSVSIPPSVTFLGDRAFDDCTSLSEVQFGGGIVNIGGDPFGGTPWKENLPNGFNYIDDKVAYWYKYDGPNEELPEELEIKEGTLQIAECFINGHTSWGSTAIIVPSTVTDIDYLDRESYIVSESNPVYSSKDGVLFDKAKTTLINYPYEKTDTIYKIPESVTSVGEHAFSYSDIQILEVPVSVTSFGDFAFSENDYLTDIYYAGTEAQWQAIGMGDYGNEALTTATIHYQSSAPAIGDLPADLNGDGEFSVADAVSLTKYLLGIGEFDTAQYNTADVNYDSCVDGFDLAILKRMLLA